MSFKPDIKQGDILNNKNLSEVFKCGNMGGMRRAKKTNTLVIVSDHTKGLYDDKWYGDEFHYTGMGKVGQMSIDFSQNKTLAKSDSNNVNVHLFEVFIQGQYIYQGLVKLSEKPYQEKQDDNNGDERLVWMFPLRLETGEPIRNDEEVKVKPSKTGKIKSPRKFDKAKLKRIVEAKVKKPASTSATATTTYDRDQNVVDYALERAKGDCQLCEQPAPFKKKSGEPYLQVHHIDYLAKGGSDTYDNVAALCPNCHAKMHTLEDKKDIEKLKKLALIEL